MTFKANYKSVIAVGGFNPTILTPDFLGDYCLFRSDEEPRGSTTPVLAEIVYGNIRFLAELNRLQITLSEIENFEGIFPIDVMIKYLEVLKYTPLSLFGINFNYQLSEINEPNVKQALKEPFQLEKTFGFVPSSVVLRATKPNGDGLSLNELTVTQHVTTEIKNSLKFSFGNEIITVNENYEVSGLDKNRERISAIIDNYPKLLENNSKLIKLIGGL